MKKSKKMTLLYLSLVLVLFVLVYFVFFYYEKVETLTYGGYYLSGTDIKKNLDDLECTEKVKLEYVEDYSTLYKKNDKFYANKDKEILIDYPGYSKDENRIINYNDNVNFIDFEFEKTSGYQNTILNERKIYNGVNLSSIDDLEYLFIEYETLYVNSTVMKIGDKEIPEYSIISFNNDYLSFYYKDGENLKLERILNIGNKDTVEFYMVLDETGNTIKINYGDLLVKLNLKNEEIEYDVNKEILIREIEDIIIDSKPKKKEENNYEKPTVTISNIVTDTYSIELDINVIDRTHQIKKNPTIEITLNDGTYLRKTAKGDGHLVLTGLLPNTEFGIIGTYTYYDKEGSLFLATFYNGKITTRDKDQVGYIIFDNKIANPAKKQIIFDEIKFTNESDIKALYGVKQVELDLEPKVFNLGSNSVNRLKNGQSITFESPNSLETNTEYNGKFVVYDLAGNIMKVKNNEFIYHTSKEIPKVNLTIEENDITYFTCKLEYDNPDSAAINNAHYDVYDGDGHLVTSGELSGNNEIVKVSDLETNQIYRFVVYGDYDLLDGEGTRTNNILGETKISTTPIASLGYGNVHFEHVETFIDSDTYTMGLNAGMIDEQLLSLMTGLKFIVRDKDEHIVDEFTIDDERIDELLHNQSINIKFSNLESNSDYTLEVITIVTQGTTAYELITVSNLTEFKTIKKDAYVVITDPFINESVIDFDAQIIDVDGAIDGDVVTIKVRDYDHKLILLKTLTKNSDPEEIYIDKLEKDKEYTITFEVEEYNTGLTKATAISNKILFEKVFITEVGLSGSLKLESLKKQVTSNNIFDLTDQDAWKIDGSANDNDKGFEINTRDNSIKFKTKNNVSYYYYYVGSYLNVPLHISFDFKTHYTEGKTSNYFYMRLGNSEQSYVLGEITNVNEYKHVEYDIIVSNYLVPYIRFDINSTDDIDGYAIIKNMFITPYNMTPRNISDSEYYGHVFENTTMKSGSEQMPSYTSSSLMEGNSNSNGYARITNLSNGTIYKYEYTGSEQPFIVPENGYYKIECWGASGGISYVDKNTSTPREYEGGRGAYVSGDIKLIKNEILYVVVGGKGSDGVIRQNIAPGGYNGGGDGTWDRSDDEAYGGGGGATDIRLLATTSNRSINTRIMVAGGGAGGFGFKSIRDNNIYDRYDAGGITSSSQGSGSKPFFTATQTSGYKLGEGESQTSTLSNTAGSGAGGGWYGGFTRKPVSTGDNVPASGGSSYISGHYGCIAQRLHENYQSRFLNEDKYAAKNKLVSTILVSLNDRNNEVANKEYYIEILENDVQILYETYEINKQNIIDESIYQELDKNQSFTVNLYVMIRGKRFKLDTLNFDSKGEIKTIYTEYELAKIHEYGRYLVGADIVMNKTYKYVPRFNGYIDFQGHKVVTTNLDGSLRIFYQLYKDAVVKNLVVEAHSDIQNGESALGTIFYQNRGTFENVYIHIYNASNCPGFHYFAGMGYVNYGTIRNFVVELHDDINFLSNSTLGTFSNVGTMENGYIFSANGSKLNGSLLEPNSSDKQVGGIVSNNNTGGVLKNVFSTIDWIVPTPEQQEDDYNRKVGNLAGYAIHGATYNSFSYMSSESSPSRILKSDPNFYNQSRKVSNVYYISDINFTTDKNYNKSKKASKLALWSTEFYNNTINLEGGYDVENYVPFGYYPQLKWPNCMPNQELVELPRIESGQMFDVVNTKVLEENWNDDTATAEIIVNVPTEDFELKSFSVESNGYGGGVNTSRPYLDYEILESVYKDGQITAKVLFKNPQKHVSGYSILSMTGRMGASNILANYESGERVIDMSFYNKINDEDDFKAISTAKITNQNYVLMNDLDMSNYVNVMLTADSTYFTGNIEGNGHTIWNMKSTTGNGIFARYFSGKLKNINFENIVETGATSATYVGLFAGLYNGAEIDNVHIKNLNITRSDSTTVSGGLTGDMQNTYVTNTSINNLILTGNHETGEHLGGLAGRAYYSVIENTFISNMNLDTTSYSGFLGVGGFIGRYNTDSMRNVYATGSINASSQVVGGLIGYQDSGSGIIESSYSNVDIHNTTRKTGGIAGSYYDSTSPPSKTLYVGNMDSSKIDDLGRILGDMLIRNDNYAFKEQHLNGFPSEKTSGEILISREELNKIDTYRDYMDWSTEYWDFSQLGDNSLPLLKYTYKDEVLPNQEKNYLPTFDLEVKSIQTSQTVNNASVTMIITNPNNKNITDIELEGLIINNKSIHTSNGETTLVLEVKPSLYLDQYKIKRVTYKEGDNYKLYSLDSILELQFFKYIKSYEDWQGISKNVAENYKLASDIDFTGRNNMNREVMINRLEGLEGNNYSLKNINLTSNTSIALIASLGYASNITFENVNIYGTANRTGIIRVLLEEMDKVNFINCTINKNNTNYAYIGDISLNKGNLKNINVYSNTVYGWDYVGGLAAYSNKVDYSNINIYSSAVYQREVNANYAGNLIGYLQQGTYITGSNIHGENLIAIGNNYVGGLFGYNGAANHTSVDNVYAKGNNYVAGISAYAGDYSTMNYNEGSHIRIDVRGDSGGGLLGYGSAFSYFKITDSVINGTQSSRYVSGLSGTRYGYGDNYNLISNCIVRGGTYVGGFDGYQGGTGFYRSQIYSTTVYGYDYVGGAFGGQVTTHSQSPNASYNTISATVLAKGTNVGGLSGFNDITALSSGIKKFTVASNLIEKSTIRGYGNVGGLIGGQDTELDDEYKQNYWTNNAYYNFVFANIGTYDFEPVYTDNVIWNPGGIDVSNGLEVDAPNKYRSGYIKVQTYNNFKIGASSIVPDTGSPQTNEYYIAVYAYQSNGTYLGKVVFTNDKYSLNKNLHNLFKGNVNYDPIQFTNANSNIYYYRLVIYTSNPSSIKSEFTRRDKYLESVGNVGAVLGTGDYLLNNSLRQYVYTGTTINGEYAKNVVTDIPSTQFLGTSKDEFKKALGNTSEYNYDVVDQGYFPILKNNPYSIHVPLPGTGGIEEFEYDLNALKITEAFNDNYYMEMPDTVVYPSSENTVNLEFSKTDGFTVIVGENHYIPETVMTFNYNYTDDFKYSIYDGLNTIDYVIKSDELSKKLYVDGDNYYYIDNGNIKGNTETISGDYIHIFDGIAIDKNGNTFDLKERTKNRVNYSNLTKVETKPIVEYDKKNNNIKSFAFHSLVNGNMYEKQIIIKNENTTLIGENYKTKPTNMTVDSYNDKEYLLILGNDNRIYSYKDEIKYPSSFVNRDIIEISSNYNNNSKLIMCRYSDGGILVFNYFNGKIILDLRKNESDFKSFLESMFVDTYDLSETSYNAEYKASKKLIKELEKTSIESVIDDKIMNYDRDYELVYNPSKDSFDVYEANTYIETSKSIRNNTNDTKYNEKSINDILYSEPKYSSNYKHLTVKKHNYNFLGILAFILTILLTIFMFIMLRKNLKLKRAK